MSHKIIKFGMLALVALALTYCQREDAPEAPQQDPVPTVNPQAVVSLNEAKSLFEASENQKQTANATSRSSKLFIELAPYWESFFQGKTPLENVYASVPVTVVGTDVNAEVLFLKENGTTKQYLFVTDIDSLATDKQIINADYYLFDTKGYFISAFRMTDGLISHRLVPKKKGTYRWVHNPEKMQTSMSWGLYKGNSTGRGRRNLTDIEMDEPSTMYGKEPIELETVTVYGRHLYIPPIYFIPNYFVYPSYDREDSYRNKEFDTGGGGGDSYSGNSKKGSSDIGADLTKVKMDGGDNIINELENPCAKALVDKAPTLANDIATLLNNTFGTNDCFNITFVQESLKDDTDGNTKYIYVSDTKDVIDIKITLNSKMLNTATNEYILATIYHEVLHAYFNVELAKLDFDNKKFEQKYPGAIIHNATGLYTYKERNVTKSVPYSKIEFVTEKKGHLQLVPFIDKLAKAIQSYNSNIPTDVAKAIARMGIVRGKDMLDWEIAYNINERTGNNNRKGTKCIP